MICWGRSTSSCSNCVYLLAMHYDGARQCCLYASELPCAMMPSWKQLAYDIGSFFAAIAASTTQALQQISRACHRIDTAASGVRRVTNAAAAQGSPSGPCVVMQPRALTAGTCPMRESTRHPLRGTRNRCRILRGWTSFSCAMCALGEFSVAFSLHGRARASRV